MVKRTYNGRSIRIDTIVFWHLFQEIMKAGYSPNQVAQKIGVEAHTIYRKLRGRTAWTLWEAIAIKQAIGYQGPLEELFRESSE